MLFLITFLVILPIFTRRWPYSVYHHILADAEQQEEADSSSVPVQSRDYLDGLTSHQSVGRDENNDNISLLVTIVTVRREGRFYLSRVVSRLHQLILSEKNNGKTGVLICNVDSKPELHQEAEELARIYPVIRKLSSSSTLTITDLFEKEKEDYAFCLNASRNLFRFAQHLVLLEDDALPVQDFLPVTRRFLNQLDWRHPDFFYLKLFHPERLQGYIQPEPWRWFEWLALSTLMAYFAVMVIGRKSLFFFLAVYFFLLTGCLGRQHLLLPLRRWMSLYSLLSATHCCTPAMAFSRDSALRVVHFLSSITCRKGYAKDTALHLHVGRSTEKAFVIEPNLVHHIGLKSTLRGP